MSTGMVQALGVGDINLRSSLNQPLDAEIDLLQVRDLTSEEIRSMLASPDDFGRAGIERSFFLTDLKFTPVVKPNGKSVIRVTSSRPVNEPYLNFLMEVRWPSGKVLREFTVLLDPPLYQPSSVVSSTPVTPASSAANVTPPRPQPTIAPAQPRGSSPYAPATAPQRAASATEWRTDRSDTLWEIALKSRPAGANVHQTMLAIQDLNPNAFINGNINQLKSGQTLNLPSSEQAGRRSGSEAVAEVAAQNRAWQEGRSAPASTAAPSAPSAPQLDARQRTSAGDAPEQVAGEDSLRLVSGADEQNNQGAGEGEADTGNASQLRDSLDRTKEQLDAAEREKAEMGDRLDDVQGQLETLQRLLELKDAQLAALQQEISEGVENSEPTAEPPADLEDLAASEQQAEAPAAEADAAQPEAVAAESEEPVDAAESVPTDSTVAADPMDPLAEAEADAAEQSAAQAEIEAAAEDANTAAPVAAIEAETPPEAKMPEQPEPPVAQSLLERMMQNQMLLIGGGVVAILLLLMVLMAVSRRNARREADMADNFIANAADGHDSSLDPNESDDFNVALAAELDDEDAGISVDPLIEADGLLAYGKPEEARTVLLAALEDEPERTDLRLKLLEVEALLENAEGYRAQHEALRAAGTVDDQVDAMDARFPLMAAAVAGAAAGLAYELGDDDVSFTMPADEPQAQVVEEEDMDFDFSEFEMGESVSPAVELEPEVTPAADATSDFDLDFDLDETPAVVPADQPKVSDTEDSLELDETLDFSEFESLDAAAEPETSASSLDDDFDLSLTDDLQSDSLAADFEAVNTDAKREADDFSLSEEDVADFEVELDEAASSAASADVALPLDTLELDEVDSTVGEDDDLMPLDNMTEEPVAGDLDEDDDEFDFLSGTDECATKLDLARAYIDMGDNEGARDILNEVVDEGNEQQQQEARSMMERLTD
ncbi:MAG: FimV/HubP family polar landmark protein [Halopseudomonas sp.]|uniref:FimV/HubP family polar landmark protein n=1 Tax=Halopseudomonas sp. TaxID=2901191 RepID=UPI0030031EB3